MALNNIISGGSDQGSNPNSVYYQLGDFEQVPNVSKQFLHLRNENNHITHLLELP